MRAGDPRPLTTAARAAAVIEAARAAGLSIATAESLTGGAVSAALTAIPGASDVMRGGVVAYLPAVKTAVLGVAEATLASAGVVSEATALEMARGARGALGADVAVATTGAAGPESHDGASPGTVCLAVADAAGGESHTVRLTGERGAVTAAAVDAALDLLAARLAGSADR
ncbi:CinA family protein [Demequina activiva]|uniref:CinA C-terminal domain-containing protein n=1 Tax=Demequina activiva TaxID=1582364 RepID=A0A919UJD0_9MICO|nr:CinA family protein [Demequina activiva]GIG54251.1 hypothetical protein Dac01nite_10030 [Demequina activiva]